MPKAAYKDAVGIDEANVFVLCFQCFEMDISKKAIHWEKER